MSDGVPANVVAALTTLLHYCENNGGSVNFSPPDDDPDSDAFFVGAATHPFAVPAFTHMWNQTASELMEQRDQILARGKRRKKKPNKSDDGPPDVEKLKKEAWGEHA